MNHSNKNDKVLNLSPSSSNRWLRCSGSIFLDTMKTSLNDNFSSIGAIKHSAIHNFLSQNIQVTKPSFHIDDIYDFLDKVNWLSFIDLTLLSSYDANNDKSIKDLITKNDISLFSLYLDAIRHYNFDDIIIEKRIDIIGDNIICGTPDIIGIYEDEIHVFDLKTGIGNQISPKGNTQLLLYAYGYIKPTTKAIYLYIVQPDFMLEPQFKYHRVTEDDMEWFEKKLTNFIYEISNNMGVLDMGEHCKYCPSIMFCPLYKSTMESLNSHLDSKIYCHSISELEDIWITCNKIKFLAEYAKKALSSRLENEKGHKTYLSVKKSNRKINRTALKICLNEKKINMSDLCVDDLTIKTLKNVLTDAEISNISETSDIVELKIHDLYCKNPYERV
ncbi:MAG: DUF2800 domain-containing protein [Paraclostridium sp.]